jgi:hypothetical protein
MMKQKLFIAALILACFSLLAYTAQASLIVTTRADSVSGTGITMVDGQHVSIVAGSTGTVTFGIYTSWTNADGIHTNDGMLTFDTALIASNGSTHGAMATANLTVGYGWTYTGKQVGKVQDINADTYSDLGGLTDGTAATEKLNEIKPMSTYIDPGSGIEGYRMLGASETNFLIGEVTYTISSAAIGTDTMVNASPWTRTVGATVGGWKEDGVSILQSSTNVTVPDTGVALNVVPEPATLIMLCMGALALLAIRRRK